MPRWSASWECGPCPRAEASGRAMRRGATCPLRTPARPGEGCPDAQPSCPAQLPSTVKAPRQRRPGSARLAQVAGARPLGRVDDVELDDLALFELVEVDERQLGAVEEHFVAVVGADEAETSVGDDLLDAACGHGIASAEECRTCTQG